MKEEGERLRKAKERRYEKENKDAEGDRNRITVTEQQDRNELGPLDTTIRLKWQRKQFPQWENGFEVISGCLPVETTSIDSIVVSSKLAINPKLTKGTALVVLKTLTAAIKVLEAAGKGKLGAIEASWASGQEPTLLSMTKEREKGMGPNGKAQAAEDVTKKRSSPSKVSNLDENSVLDQLRARERERKKMEEEIRKQDVEDEMAA